MCLWVRAPLFPLLTFHLIELKFRAFYFGLSFLLCWILFFIYLPSILEFSPYFFLNHKWEDALFAYLSLSFLLSFLTTSPILFYNLYIFITPGLLPIELDLIHSSFTLLLPLLYLYWFSGPWIIFNLPTFFLSYHTDTILLSPILKDFVELIFDYYLCSIFILLIPLLVYYKFSRKFLYLFAILLSSIFGDWVTILMIFIPLVIIIELSTFWILITKNIIKYLN